MNKQRRKTLATLQEQIALLVGQIEDLRSEVEAVLEEEQEYYDNMPESFQDGEKGQAAQAAIDAIQNIVDALESAGDELDVESHFDEATA